MKLLFKSMGFIVALSAAIAANAATTYSFDGKFSRYDNGNNQNPYRPYDGAFGGTFTYDGTLATPTITEWDVWMDLKLTSGAVVNLEFSDEGNDLVGAHRHAADITSSGATFRYSFSWSSSPKQDRLRFYLDDTSNWGDPTVTLDYVWGDRDTFTGGRGFVGTSPHNNTTPPDNTAITLTSGSAVVPVPAAVWLFASGLIGLVGLARRKTTA